MMVASFSYSDIELAKKTKAKKRTHLQVKNKNILTAHKFCTFPTSDLDLAEMSMCPGHYRRSGHKQCLCQVTTSNGSALEKKWSGPLFCTLLTSDLDLPQMTLVKVITHPVFINNFCVK